MAIEDVTRGDLEQMFQDHTDKILTEMHHGFKQAADERAELRATLDRLDKRTDEEIRDVYKRLEVLEKLNGITPLKAIQAE